MMILRNAPASPFGRKVRIAASVLGLSDAIRIESADTTDPKDTLRSQNPLGKLPVLIDEDGEIIFDSRVILEYLDQRAGGGKILPRDPKGRIATLRLQALADGMMDACLLQVYEVRLRHEDKRDQNWVKNQAEKVSRALNVLEANPPPLAATPQAGDIALACALGYLDLRFEGAWRIKYPALVRWLDAFESRIPSFAQTRMAA